MWLSGYDTIGNDEKALYFMAPYKNSRGTHNMSKKLETQCNFIHGLDWFL